MTLKSPLVSVCIPVFNTVKYIRQTIDSVLAQNYPNIEILVQDNVSTDGTWELLEELALNTHQLKIARNRINCGMSGNWNEVISRAKGDFVMLLSADDMLHPDFIASCMVAFEDVEIVAASTHYYHLHSDGSMVERGSRIATVDGTYQDFGCEYVRGGPFSINFTLFSRKAIEKMSIKGKLFAAYITCDIDLFFRLGFSGMKVRYIATPLGYYRMHESNLSNNHARLFLHSTMTLVGHHKKLSYLCPREYYSLLYYYLINAAKYYPRIIIKFLKLNRQNRLN